jgi:hypothetical protein
MGVPVESDRRRAVKKTRKVIGLSLVEDRVRQSVMAGLERPSGNHSA